MHKSIKYKISKKSRKNEMIEKRIKYKIGKHGGNMNGQLKQKI